MAGGRKEGKGKRREREKTSAAARKEAKYARAAQARYVTREEVTQYAWYVHATHQGPVGTRFDVPAPILHSTSTGMAPPSPYKKSRSASRRSRPIVTTPKDGRGWQLMSVEYDDLKLLFDRAYPGKFKVTVKLNVEEYGGSGVKASVPFVYTVYPSRDYTTYEVDTVSSSALTFSVMGKRWLKAQPAPDLPRQFYKFENDDMLIWNSIVKVMLLEADL